jgi:hypothetical protein
MDASEFIGALFLIATGLLWLALELALRFKLSRTDVSKS